VTIRVNNRKILAGIADMAGEKERITDITVVVDKLDKIGKAGVRQELLQRGISAETVAKLEPVISLSGPTSSKLRELKNVLASSEEGLKGIAEMEELFGYLAMEPVTSTVELDLSLARGLNYYTGAIIEVRAEDVAIGSVCGGGRYDDLTGIFGLPGVSGVGVSFGADRIYDVMLMLNIFPEQTGAATEALVVNFGREELPDLLKIIRSLREAGIPSEIYPDAVKLKKQFSYADAQKIPWVIIAGSDEIAEQKATVKDMRTGLQTTVSLSELPLYIKSGKAS
jgi:histidyl-tRNA synthetase